MYFILLFKAIDHFKTRKFTQSTEAEDSDWVLSNLASIYNLIFYL